MPEVIDRMTVLYCLKRNIARIERGEHQTAIEELKELTRLIETREVR